MGFYQNISSLYQEGATWWGFLCVGCLWAQTLIYGDVYQIFALRFNWDPWRAMLWSHSQHWKGWSKTDQFGLHKVAVVGIFILMKIFRISSNQGLSQLSQSSGSLSQLSVDVLRGGGAARTTVASNESLCSELLGVLRRCFNLQPRVRLTLYQVRNKGRK